MTRTSTEFPPLEPESSASANSAMAAKRGIIDPLAISRNKFLIEGTELLQNTFSRYTEVELRGCI
jgi:hypothetical protein